MAREAAYKLEEIPEQACAIPYEISKVDTDICSTDRRR